MKIQQYPFSVEVYSTDDPTDILSTSRVLARVEITEGKTREAATAEALRIAEEAR